MSHHRWELVPHGSMPREVLAILLGSLPRVPDPRQEVEAMQRQSSIHDDRLSEDDEDEDTRRETNPSIQEHVAASDQNTRSEDTKDNEGGRSWNVPDDEWEWSDGEQTSTSSGNNNRGYRAAQSSTTSGAKYGNTLLVPSARAAKDSLTGLGLIANDGGASTGDNAGLSLRGNSSHASSNASTTTTTPASEESSLSVAQDLCISVCDSGRYIACASKKMFAILKRQPRSGVTSPQLDSNQNERNGSPQSIEEWVLVGQGSGLDSPLDGITTILCLPLYAPRSINSQVYVVVGYKSGMIRIFNESGQLVVVQQLHHTPVVSIKTRVGAGRIPGEDEDEMTILHEDGKVVCIEGESLWVVLRLSSGSGRQGDPISVQAATFAYKKWSLMNQDLLVDVISCGPARHKPTLSNGFSSSSSSSMYTSQATERFISVGSKPMIAFYASSSSGRPLFSATSLATQMAARVTNAVFGFAKSIWGNSGSSRPGSPAPGANSGRSSPDSKRLSGQGTQDGTAGPYGTIYPSALAPATEVPTVLRLSDSQRCIRHVSLAPSPPRGSCYHNPSKLAAMTDSLGRVLLVDLEECEIIRMWKGLRGAKCGWIQEERTVRSKTPVTNNEGAESTEKKHLLLYLVIYAPKRGTVEIYPARQGRRVGLLQVGLGWKVCTTFASPIGKPAVLDRSLGSPSIGRSTSSTATGVRSDLAQCLLIGPTGEVMIVRSRLVDSPDPIISRSTMASPLSSSSLVVSPAILTNITTDSIASRLEDLSTS
ncbi:Rab3 GTPase-activating protein non-catalytic subunit [Entomortierella parvispora]|uniref:Rab3 GTPase-activating protein non-catalytic subunit n=1 Tax=Entomortierella parvispora TaxID=205924 RepID=A0A9P3LX05_9FUNG|nr:Rab3 GTPase-activating protein non-catalytic subunit [Entomortierella parvispora]